MNQRILIVDDFAANRQKLIAYLNKLGYENLHEAEDALDALEQINEDKPDLVLLDVSMPKLDGFLLSEIIHSVERWKDIIVIFQSALVGEENIRKGISCGAFGYLEKPIERQKLKDLLEQAFDQTNAISSKIKQEDMKNLKSIISAIYSTFNMISGKPLTLKSCKVIDDISIINQYKYACQIKALGDFGIQLFITVNEKEMFFLYKSFVGVEAESIDEAKGILAEISNICLGSSLKEINLNHSLKLDLPEFSNHVFSPEQFQVLQSFSLEFESEIVKTSMFVTLGHF